MALCSCVYYPGFLLWMQYHLYFSKDINYKFLLVVYFSTTLPVSSLSLFVSLSVLLLSFITRPFSNVSFFLGVKLLLKMNPKLDLFVYSSYPTYLHG